MSEITRRRLFQIAAAAAAVSPGSGAQTSAFEATLQKEGSNVQGHFDLQISRIGTAETVVWRQDRDERQLSSHP